MAERILTIEDVSKLMKVSFKTVYRWIDAGKLPAAKVGYKTYRVFEGDLIRFLRRNMVGQGVKRKSKRKK